MNIRTKLTLQFTSIVAVIIILCAFSIYYFSASYRIENFYDRLKSKAVNTAKLLIEVEEVSSELLRKIEKDNPVSLPKEKIIIYNYKDEIVFTTDERKDIRVTTDLINKIRLEGEISFVQNGYECLGFLFADKYDRFVVISGAVDIYGVRRLTNLRWILIAVFCSSILLAFFSGWIFSGKVLVPISKVIDEVNDISITSLNLRVSEGNGKDEIAKLAQTFNRMLERLEAAFKIQKNFIANASHELRTPLTVITGELEVTLNTDRSVDEYKETITSVLEDMKNLNNISNRLLLLAQTSTESKHIDFKSLRIDDIIWQARTELLKRNQEYDIQVKIDENIADEQDFIIAGNELLIKTFILNLMDNGCKYSNDKTVEVLIKADSEYLTLTFSDKGIGIPEDEVEHIFEPFHRAKNSFTVKGHGIGLSLVLRIVKLHNGTIQVYSQLDKESVFTVKLPKL